MIRAFAICLIGVVVSTTIPAAATGQDSSLLRREVGGELSLEHASPWYFRPAPPRKIKMNDLVTVVVNEASSSVFEGEVDRRKTGKYLAAITDWVNFRGSSLKSTPQQDGDPTAGGTINQTYRSEAELETRSRLQFRITCRVVDIRPNGNMVLEATKHIREVNEELEMSLTGIIRPDDIRPDNTVLSERVYQLSIYKRQRGHVRDGFRRGWITKILDQVNPF